MKLNITDIFTVLSRLSQDQIDHLAVLDNNGELLAVMTQDNLNPLLNSLELYDLVMSLQHKVDRLELEKQDFLKQQQVETVLKTRAKQQEAIANLTQEALSLTRLDALLHHAVTVVAQILDIPYSSVLQYLPSEGRFEFKSGIGWSHQIKQTRISTSSQTQAGCTLNTAQAVIVSDFRVETRFRDDFLRWQTDIVSGVTVIIAGKDYPFGVLGVHSPEAKSFSDDDINFLQAIANIIALTVKRLETEEELNQFLNLSVDLFCIAGIDGYFKRINPQFQTLLGYSEAELLSQPLLNFVHPEDRARTQSELVILTQGASCRDFQNRYRCKDGSYRWFSWTSTAFEQDLLYAVARDITENKQFEQQLQTTQRRYATLAEVSPVGIFHTNTQGKCLYVNQRWCEITGLSLEDMVNRCWNQAVHPEDQERVSEQWHTATLQDQLFQCEYRFLRSDGTIAWVYGQATAEYNANGMIVGYVGTITDISDRKHAELALQTLNQQLEDRIEQRTAQLRQTNRQLLEEVRQHQQTEIELKQSQHFIQSIADATPNILYIYDLIEDRNIYVNREVEILLGYTLQQIQNMNQHVFTNLIHPEDLAKIPEHHRKFNTAQDHEIIEIEYRVRDVNGNWHWFLSRDTVFTRTAEGQPKQILGAASDITERKQAEEQLRLSERAIATSINGIVLADARLQDHPITFVNPAFEKMTGYSASEVLGKNCRFLQGKDCNQPELQKLRTALKNQESCTIILRNYRKNGTLFWNELNISPIYDEQGNLTHYLGIQIDISDRYQAEKQLQATNEQLQAVLDAVPGFVSWVNSDLHYLGVNRQLAEAMNLSPEDFIGQKVGFLEPYSSAFSQFFCQFFNDSNSSTCQKTLEIKVGNETRFYLLIAQKYNQGQAAISVGIDITEPKQIEAQLRATTSRLSTLIENLQLGVLVEDEHQQIVLANQTFFDLFKIQSTSQNLIGKNISELTQSYQKLFPDNLQFMEQYQQTINQEKIVTNEEIKAVDGRTFERDYVPIKINHQYQGHLWIYRDISDRKKAEIQLKNSLQEKETLLKEIHHRVKNNLFVVANLLEFQSDYFDDPKLIQALEDSTNRVYSMALIHEKLYQSTNLNRINLGEYLEQLVEHLLESYNSIHERVEFEPEIEPIFLNIETAHPCGLIVNELISNVFKHAFPNEMTGKVSLKLHQNAEGLVILEVQDNGIGFPADLDFQNVDSLGMELICTLTTQLEGNLELIPVQGTMFKLTFSELQYQQRY